MPGKFTRHSATGVMGLVQRMKPLPGHMGVDLGGGQIRVAEKHLDNTQVRPMIEEMRGKRMPERMGREVLPDTHSHGVVPDTVPESLTRHGGCPVTGE